MNARALEFTAPYEVRVVEVELEGPRDHEVLVRSLYSGISSGTELLAFRGEVDPRLPLDESIGALGGTFSYPFRYGYSCVGTVEESASELSAGTLIFAFHPHQDAFVVPSADVVVLRDIDPRTATMLPLVETALQIALDAGPLLEEPVVVMGLGCVGLLTSLLLQRSGAVVLGVDPSQARRRFAEDVEIKAVPPDQAREGLLDLAAVDQSPLVVEVSGNPDALATAMSLLAHEGVALIASWYGTKPVMLSLGAEFHRRRLTIRSTQVSTIPARLSDRWTVQRRRVEALRLAGALPLKKLATHEFDFDQATDAFATLARGQDAVVHAAFRYERH